MSRRPNHSPAFKAKEAIAAIKGERTIAQIAEQFDVHLALRRIARGERRWCEFSSLPLPEPRQCGEQQEAVQHQQSPEHAGADT